MGNVCCAGNEERKAGALQAPLLNDRSNVDQWNATASASSQPNNLAPNDSNLSSPHPMSKTGKTSAPGSANNLLSAEQLARQQPPTAETLRLQQEAARINELINSCGQQMVTVRSSSSSSLRGGPTINYFDQGFAAALRSHLEQTTKFPSMPNRLPEVNANIINSTNNSSTSGASKTATAGDGTTHTNETTLEALSPSSASAAERKTSNTTTISIPELLAASPWQDVHLGDHVSGLANCGGENPLTYMDRLAEAYLEEVIPKKQSMFRNAPPIVENLL